MDGVCDTIHISRRINIPVLSHIRGSGLVFKKRTVFELSVGCLYEDSNEGRMGAS